MASDWTLVSRFWCPRVREFRRARLTLGLSTLPLKVSGLENIHISDRKPGSPDATAENRLALNIAENNTSTFFAPGVKFDAGYAVIPNELDLLLEVGVNIMEAKAVSIGFGADFTVYRDVGLHIQGLGRLGLIGLRVGGTKAIAVEGFEDVVAVDFGTMQVGDEIQATLGGITRAPARFVRGNLRWNLAPHGSRSISGISWAIKAGGH